MTASNSVKDYLTEEEAAELLTVAPMTLRNWRRRGTGPSHFKFGALVRYRRAEVEAWIESRRGKGAA